MKNNIFADKPFTPKPLPNLKLCRYCDGSIGCWKCRGEDAICMICGKYKEDKCGCSDEPVYPNFSELNASQLLSWWIFYNLDSVPADKLKPDDIENWMNKFEILSITDIHSILNGAYRRA